MSEEIKMPALGESVTEGTVTQWLKSVGDTIEVDEPLLEVSTDKVDTEVPSPVAGVLEKIVVDEDETAEVGAVLAIVGDGSGSADDSSADEAPAQDEKPAEEEPAKEEASTEEKTEEAPASSGSSEGEKVAMPALGESVTEGTVTQWLKSVGDTVEVDEPLLEVSTDKVDTEVPSPVAGTILEILVGEDETAEVGAPLVIIGSGDAKPAAKEEAPAQDEKPAEEEPAKEEAPAEEKTEEAPASSGSSEGEKVAMPALGESVTEGTVTQWLKSVGDTVEVDEPLLEVSTDKVDTEVPSPVAGTILEILVGEDETAEVGAPLAIIGSGDAKPAAKEEAPAQDEKPAEEEPAKESSEEPQETEAKPEPPQAAEAEKSQAPAGTPSEEAEAPVDNKSQAPAKKSSVASSSQTGYVTPIVRKLAKKLDVDLANVKGTGVGGRIRRQDVEEAAKAAQSAPAATQDAAPAAEKKSAVSFEASPLRGTTEKMSRLRQVISKRMVESLQTAAQLTTVVEVDVTKIVALRNKSKNSFQEKEGTKLTYLPFFIKAATEALKAHPKINARIVDDKQVEYFDHENVGIAVDTERGLMVPVIKNAGDLNIAGISKAVNDLAGRTRDGKITPDELSGGTFTITNTGSAGALFDTPIINQPESAILGVGTIYKRPAVVTAEDGTETIGIRSFVYLALSYDHRLVDGADAGRYLSALRARLEEGAFGSELGL